MDIVNIEIKAKCSQLDKKHKELLALGADFKGVDHQIDTYYNTNCGRLKLRQGTIENALIFYQRPESKELKQSDVILNRLNDEGTTIGRQLEAAYGIKKVVDKQRRIYFIGNVKFHLDEVVGLGTFIEIEAIGKPGEETALSGQCQQYVRILNIESGDFIDKSYSDML